MPLLVRAVPRVEKRFTKIVLKDMFHVTQHKI